MREIIKKYKLSDNISIYNLAKNNFIKVEPKDEEKLKFTLIKPLLGEIELHMEIIINEDGSFLFDDYENIIIFDEDFGQPYQPFYNDEKDFDFLNDVIIRYNRVMDKLVEQDILKPVELEQENTPKKLINKRIEE